MIVAAPRERERDKRHHERKGEEKLCVSLRVIIKRVILSLGWWDSIFHIVAIFPELLNELLVSTLRLLLRFPKTTSFYQQTCYYNSEQLHQVKSCNNNNKHVGKRSLNFFLKALCVCLLSMNNLSQECILCSALQE